MSFMWQLFQMNTQGMLVERLRENTLKARAAQARRVPIRCGFFFDVLENFTGTIQINSTFGYNSTPEFATANLVKGKQALM